jgi:hypothetical protein
MLPTPDKLRQAHEDALREKRSAQGPASQTGPKTAQQRNREG